MIRVALVDDQAIVRAGLARILSPTDGFEVVAECVGGHEAVERLPALRPDVILMDIRMPGLDGIAATARLRSAVPHSPVLVLTTFGEDEVLWGAIEAGAAGFVLKDSSAEDLISAVRAVAGGGAWFDPGVAPRVLDRYRRVVAPATRDAARLQLLTDREHDVLRLMARGATNAEIAARLYVAEATVKTHVGSIFTKLGVRDRAAAIVFAYDHGVVSAGTDVSSRVGAELGPAGRCAARGPDVASALMTERLAVWSSRRPWPTLAGWAVALVAAIAIIAAFVGDALSGDEEITSNTESRRADRLQFAGFADGSPDVTR